jgi:hypothetical protein
MRTGGQATAPTEPPHEPGAHRRLAPRLIGHDGLADREAIGEPGLTRPCA